MNILGDHSQFEIALLQSIAKEIYSCSSLRHLHQLIAKYKNSNHPDPFYHLGVICIQNKKYEEAKILFKKGAQYGLKYPNRYFNTIFSDSIGQCFYHLVMNIEIYDYNFFVLAYIYLSNCINLSPRKTYDSRRSRALLINTENSYFVDKFRADYLGIEYIKEPLVISDFYFASLGFENNFNIKSQCLSDAKKIHDWLEDITVAGKDACDYSIEEISIIGETRHKKIYDNVLVDFMNNKFFF
jgi:hypothetical protein